MACVETEAPAAVRRPGMDAPMAGTTARVMRRVTVRVAPARMSPSRCAGHLAAPGRPLH